MASRPPRSRAAPPVAIVTLLVFALQACTVTRAVALKDLETGRAGPEIWVLPKSGSLWRVYRVERVADGRLEATYRGWAREAGDSPRAGTADLNTVQKEEANALPEVGSQALLDFEEYREVRVVSAGRTFGKTVLVTAGVLAVVAVIAVASKTSCPFVYADDGAGGTRFVGEAYSGSTGLATARDDLLPLPPLQPGERRIVLSNEAEETQYTDRLELWVIERDTGVRALATGDGRAVLVGAASAPARAVDLDGIDVLRVVAGGDDDEWRTELAAAAARDPAPVREGLELTFAAPAGASVLELDVGNTPWLDVVFGRVFALAGDRLPAYQREGDDPAKTAERWAWRDREGVDLRVEVLRDGRWERVGIVPTPGPMSRRTLAVPLPAAASPELRVRVSGGIGFWRIDRAAISPLLSAAPEITRLAPSAALGADGSDARALLAATDRRPHVLADRGEALELRFEVPAPARGREHDAFLATHGWYHVHPPPQARLQLLRARQLRTEEGALARFGLELWRDYERTFASARSRP